MQLDASLHVSNSGEVDGQPRITNLLPVLQVQIMQKYCDMRMISQGPRKVEFDLVPGKEVVEQSEKRFAPFQILI